VLAVSPGAMRVMPDLSAEQASPVAGPAPWAEVFMAAVARQN
jgi:hypothetical protein